VTPEDHCHRERNEEIDKKARKKLLVASVLCVVFMIAEIVGNIMKFLMTWYIKFYLIEIIYIICGFYSDAMCKYTYYYKLLFPFLL